MLRRAVASLFLFALVLLSSTTVLAAPSPALVASATLSYFTTEASAQEHCPRDVVVWLNVPSGIYHYKGERWYGRTRHGAYVCEREAIAAGDRASKNGQ